MKLINLITLALACLISFSSGSEKMRNCQIIFLDLPRKAPREFQLFDGTTSHTIELPSRNLSRMVELPLGNLELSIANEVILQKQDLPKDAPTVKISAEINDLYLIVFSDPKNDSLPLRIEIVDAGQEIRKPGQNLWINLTKDIITAQLGTKSLKVMPKGRAMCGAPLSESGYYKAEFFYQKNGEGEVLPIMSKSWWFDARSINVSFIMRSGGRLPRTFTFADIHSNKSK